MKRVAFCTLLLGVTVLLAQEQKPPSSDVEEEHTQWIASVIDSENSIRPGMTRKDLLELFTEEGGLSTRKRRTYVYRQCRYIKINVEFSAVGEEDPFKELPGDKITKVSLPFLQYSIMD